MRLATTAESYGAVQNAERHRQIEQTAVLDGQNVLVSGSNGMGRSTFLAAVSGTLTVEGRTTRTVSCHDPDMVNVIAQTPRDDVLLVDDLEYAGCNSEPSMNAISTAE